MSHYDDFRAGLDQYVKEYIDTEVETREQELWETVSLTDLAAIEDIEEWDNIEKPKHYNSHPSGVQCIEIAQHMNFCLGNAIKYIWRAGIKSDDVIEDLKKAKWYIEKEIERLNKESE